MLFRSAAIPAGVADGQKIRLKGQGSHSQTGGPPGDLLIAVKIAPHALFRPEGANLLLDLPLSIDEAVLGGPVRVPALNGAVDLNIPAGANNGQTLRLRGRGLPGKSGQGDLLVTLRIALPGDDAALRKYAESLRKSGSYNARGPEFGE